jgi:hypothetical protein
MHNCATGEHHHHGHHELHGSDSCECHSGREHRAGCECGGGAEHSGRDGCCHGSRQHGFRRRYTSKAEVIAELESYLVDLKAEAQAVEEHLNELRG